MAESKYVAIARSWRPQTFDEVVGQDHITRTLKNAITSGRIHHAFLFIGSRGIGKTTTARILAKALNCLGADAPTVSPCGTCDNCVSISQGNNIDVIEIDGASNNTVEDVRSLRESVRMVASASRYKVYIIDEVHQLSGPAFNALLKTLEEPPAHAIFILATTEAQKIPATIISRCQRYDFRRVAVKDLVELLRRILKHEKRQATEEALYAVARAAEGGVRDSESILDELITYCEGEITFKDVLDLLGLVDWRIFHELCDSLLAGSVVRQLEIVEAVVAEGKDLSVFIEDLLRYFRNLLVCRTAAEGKTLLHLPDDEIEALHVRARRLPATKLIRIIDQLSDVINGGDSQLSKRTALEAMLIRLSRVDVEVSLDTIMEKLMRLGQGGVVPSATVAARPSETPPNPPEAGPACEAPPVPASRGCIRFGADDLMSSWRAFTREAERVAPSLVLHLGRAQPASLENGDTLDLEFEPGAKRAYAFFQKAENIRSLRGLLSSLTENVRAVRTYLAAEADRVGESFDTPDSLPDNPAPLSDYCPPPVVQAFAGAGPLDDPQLGVVIDEFRGTVVQVRRGKSDASK